jgi:predicted phosphodiesterase
VLDDIAREGVDVTVNLGDILSGPLQPAETADLLMARNFPTIRGNHERQVLATLDKPAVVLNPLSTDDFTAMRVNAAHIQWMRSLPATLMLTDDVMLCHGTPTSDLHYWLETVTPDFDRQQRPGLRYATAAEVRERLGGVTNSLVLCGHTHVPRVMQCGGTLVVNPGSVGLQAYDDTHPHAHVVETGAPHARYAVIQEGPHGWRAELRAVPYDHQTQADVARRNGRADWGHALATGFVER